MKIPLILSYDSAYVITSQILRSSTQKQKRHLLEDNLNRMEQIAKKVLGSFDEIEVFLIDFLKGSSVYFSTTFINHNVIDPNRVNVELPMEVLDVFTKLSEETRKIKKENGVRIPLSLVGNNHKPRNVNSKVYLYCIKSGAVLVLSTEIKGDIVPRLDDWGLSFRYAPITFLNFQLEAEYIPNSILNTPLLRNVNHLVSHLFPTFINQAALTMQHFEEEEMDQKALDSLTPLEKKQMFMYMPILYRYIEHLEDNDDLSLKLSSITDRIEERWKEQNRSEQDWVIISPSYCLPIWFPSFFDWLSDEEKCFFEQVNPMDDTDLVRVISLFELFYEDDGV